MQNFKNELISEVIIDDYQRSFLETRFGIVKENKPITFQDWCEKAALKKELVIQLVSLFLQPQKQDVANFNEIPTADFINYIKASHQFYNDYYLKKLDQLATVHQSITKHHPNVKAITKLIAKFNSFFREHMKHEDELVLPYINYLSASPLENFSVAENFAVLLKHQYTLNDNHEAEEHSLIQVILKQIKKYCLTSRYDFQWSYYQHLLENFKLDLSIHEFVEDKIILPRAEASEQKVLDALHLQTVLN